MSDQTASAKIAKPSSPQETSGYAIYKRLLAYTRHNKSLFYTAVFGMVLYSSADGAFAYLMKPLLDEGFVNRNEAVMLWLPIALMGVFLLRGVGSFLGGYYMTKVGRNIIKTIRGELFAKLLCMPNSFYDKKTSGELISLVTYNSEQVAGAASNAITVLIRDTFSVIVLLGYMMYLSLALTGFLIVVAPVLAWIVTNVSKRFRRISKRIQGSMGEVTGNIEEAIEGQLVVKLFGGQEYESQRFDDIISYNRLQSLKMAKIKFTSTPLIQFIVGIVFSTIVALAIYDPFGEAIEVGTFVSFFTAMMMLLQPLRRLTLVNSALQG